MLKSKYSTLAYHAKIRGWARKVYELNNGPRECYACGYDLHIDVCHIKDVRHFDLDALVSEVNDFKNLVALDRRCHWEFDNGHLRL